MDDNLYGMLKPDKEKDYRVPISLKSGHDNYWQRKQENEDFRTQKIKVATHF